MATVHSVSFTPSRAGRLLVIVSYDVQIVTGSSDWGAAASTRIFCMQGGTSYSDYQPMSTTRQRQASQHTFNVSAGSTVTVGLDGRPGATGTASWWNVSVQAILLKK